MRALWLASVLMACSGPTPDPRDVGGKSGSRLLAERWTSGGVSWFAGWYDSELDTRCEFREASDGRFRCLPTGFVAQYYADAACMRPAFRGDAGCASYASDGRTAYKLGARVTSLYGRRDGFCGPLPESPDEHYEAGEVVPPDRFVEATRKTLGNAISLEEWYGDDGSLERIRLADVQFPMYMAGGYVRGAYVPASDSFCELRLTGASTASCAGIGSRAGGVQPQYLDAQCTQLIVTSQGFSSFINIDYQRYPCADQPLYRVAEQVPVTNVYHRADDGTCTSVVTVPSVHPVTEIVDASIALTIRIEPGSSRLRHTTLSAASGETWPGPLFDMTTETPCLPRANDPASARCVPALNQGFSPSAFGNAAGTCESDTQVNVSSACWGQTVRARRGDSVCGVDQYDLEVAVGRVIDEPFFVGYGSQALWPECGLIDRTGLELREGDYMPTDATSFVGMQLVRDEP